MLGTKLLLLSFVVYVSGQGVTYYGSSNVRNQSRLPPRRMYRPPQRSQTASGPQPGVYQPPQERRLPQQTYFPDTYPPMRGPEPVPVSRSLENPPQPIYSPTVESTPRPLQTRPLQNQAPAQAPVAPAEDFTPINSEAQLAYPQSSPETYISKVDELVSQLSNLLPNPAGSTPKPASVEEPEVVLQPDAEKELPPLPTESPSDIEINPQPELVPEPELKPEMTPPPSPELILIPEPSIAPTLNQERPTLYPNIVESLIPVPNPQPAPEPQPIFPDNDFNLLPPAPRPLPTLEPVVLPELVPIIPEPAITSQPESITSQPDYQPLEPPKPVDVYLPPQPMLPPRLNYRPIPDEAVIPSTSRPLIPEPAITSQPESITFQPDYQPLEPPKPVDVYLPPQPMPPPRPNYRPIPDEAVILSTSRPLIPEPAITSPPESITFQPDYQPLEPPKPVHVYLPPQPMQPPRPNYRPIPDEAVIPSTSRPLIPEPAITSPPESITFQPDYQPLEPPKPVHVYLPPQPMQPPRPNYRPIPDEAVIPSTSRPLIPEPAITSPPESITFQPDYQPLEPPKPVLVYLPPQPMPPPRPNYRPIPDEEVIPSTSRPLSTPVPFELRPNYEPLPPRPIPENRYPSPLPTLILPTPNVVPSQPPPQPTTLLPIVIPTSVIPTSEEPLLEPEIISIMPMYDFECKNGSGYYSIVNECDTYIECQRQGTFKYTCPDGLHFNPQALYPEYPCAYPSEVKCESTATKQIARPTNQCPNRYGFFPILGEDCSKYIMCQEGMATIMNCPFGLVFNEHLSSCDWPENVPQCNSIAFKDFTCPMPPADNPDILYRFRYGSECGMYVACQRGHPRLLRCDAGLSFDENSQVCIDSDFVPDCRIPIPT